MKKRILLFVVIMVLASVLFGCVNGNNIASAADILTMKKAPAGSTDLTVLVKHAFSITAFEKAVEAKFPEINIVQVGNYAGDTGEDEYIARLKNDDLTDIVMQWPLETGKEYWKDRLLDLSTLEVSCKYTTKSLNAIADGDNGKLYYLPGPSQVRGIIYNKSLFKEKGWQVPKDFDGFVDLCQQIEKSGMRSLQLGLGNDEVLDTAFVGYGYESSYSKPGNAEKIAEYDGRTGSFADNYMPALNTFKTLADEGVLKKEDLNITYAERERMLFSRECAMTEDSVLLARMGGSYGSTDEFALMPFFNPGGENNDWARLYSVCFIGLNKHLKDAGNEKKYELSVKLMDYISTPEGQAALAGDTGAMFSNLKGAIPPDIEEIEDLENALNAGRYGVFPTLKNAQGALRNGLRGMLKDGWTPNQVVEKVDEDNLKPETDAAPLILRGEALNNFTTIETGNYITDSMRAYAQTDFALFLDNGKDGLFNGKGVRAKIYKGAISTSDIQRILPNMKQGEKGELWKIKMTGENLLKTLEYSLTLNGKTGWFYYFSGIKLEFDPLADMGSRIKNLTDNNGKGIEQNKIYTVAVMDDNTIPKEYIIQPENSHKLISHILESAITKAGVISPSNDGRMTLR